jgi:hypothetical protein
MKLTTAQMNTLTILSVKACLVVWTAKLKDNPDDKQAAVAVPALTETLAFLEGRTIA